MDKLAELEKELLAEMEENPAEYKETIRNILEIDNDLRTINIPVSVKNIGVESDDDVKRLEFTMPKQYGEFDLSQFRIRINYMNANGDKSIYLVEDKKVSGDNITFSWLIGRDVTKYKGQVNFIVCLKLSDAKGKILKELNTTLCRLEVLEGLEVVPVIDEKTTDIIEQLLRMVETETTGAVQKVTEEGNKQVKEVQKAAQEIVADREQIQKNAESVTVLKEETSELKKGILDLTKDEKLLKSINIHMLNGYFNITGNKIVGISSVVHWKNVTIDCKTNERYEILFYVGSNISVDGNILITNDSNEILEKYSGNKLDDYNVKIITIPPGGTKLNIQMFVKYADQNIFVNKYFDTTNEMTYNYKPLLMLGGINEDGTLNDNDARKRTEFIECENQLIEVFVPVGYKAYVIMYDKNKNKMDTTSSWIDASEKEKSYKYYVTGCYVIIVLKNKNDSSMVGWFAKDFYLTKETVVLDKNDRYKYFLSRQGEFTNIPTNSIQSICYAHEHGFNAIRISVLWTKDDVCVLCHDDLITKWAKKNDGSDITEQVRISELTYEQLKDYDFGVQYAQKYKGLKIAKLRDVLKLTKMLNMFLKIELKADRYDEIDNLIGDIIECGDIKNTVVSCDYYSIKKSLDYLSENYPYINLEIYANFDLNLVKQVLPYKNDTRELWIGGDKEDLEYDDRVTLDAIKLAKENDMKLSIGSAYNADELIKLYNSPFDQLSTAYIEYPKHVLDKVLKYK